MQDDKRNKGLRSFLIISISIIIGGFLLFNFISRKKNFSGSLDEVLYGYMTENHLSVEELHKELGEYLFAQPAMSIGQVGTLGNDAFVDLSSDRNSVILSKESEKTINGEPRETKEVFLISGQQVYRVKVDADFSTSDLQIIFFDRDKVSFSSLFSAGGYYTRGSPTKSKP